MIKKIIALNVYDYPRNTFLKRELQEMCKGKFDLEYVSSDDLWLEVKTGVVKIVSTAGEIDIKDSFFFVRLRGRDSAFAALICHILELNKIPFTDECNELHTDFTEKSFAIPRLAFHGFNVPDTIIVPLPNLLKYIDHIEDSFVYPCVVKGDGARGENVKLVNDRVQLLEFAENSGSENSTSITIQALIPNSYDVRALFMGEEHLGSFRRTRKPEEPLLNNASSGAVVIAENLTTEEEEVCRKVMKISYLNFCGIDFIRTATGITFLELNKSPQLYGFDNVITDLKIGESLLKLIQKAG